MAARGRFKGGSLTQEQLTSLGIGKPELTPGPMAPPPTFPKLDNAPVTRPMTRKMEYMLSWRNMWRSTLRHTLDIDTPTKRAAVNKILGIKWQPDWSRLPAELRSSAEPKKRGSTTATKENESAKRARDDQIQKRLKELEEQEVGAKKTEVKEDAESESEHEGEDQEQLGDDDLEDDTDYVYNYFDNGEAYNDDDDNLDDGPVY